MAQSIGYQMPANAVDITALSAGNWVTFVLYSVGQFTKGAGELPSLVLAGIFVVSLIAIWLTLRTRRPVEVGQPVHV